MLKASSHPDVQTHPLRTCCADVLDKRIKLTAIARDLGSSLGSGHSIVHKSVTGKRVYSTCERTSQTTTKLLASDFLMHLTRYPDQGEDFAVRLQGMKHLLIVRHQNTKAYQLHQQRNSNCLEGILADALDRGDTVSAERLMWYTCEVTTGHLSQKLRIAAPRRHLRDNAKYQAANRACDWLRWYGWEVMCDHPCSPNLAPSDFRPFGHLKKYLAGKQFAT
jgi:hypothetical protein